MQSPMMGKPEALRRFPWLNESLWEEADALFPIRLPRDYLGDATDPADPRLRTALPDPQELEPAPDDLPDPVGDSARSPLPWVVQKHADRVLLLLTKRCHLYCRYCFRRNHEPGDGQDPTPEEWENMLDFAASSGAKEVILSGGDPLAISDQRLFSAIDRLRPAIPTIRIHSRAPITFPQRVTPELVAGLKERGSIWILVHANHPAELTAPVRAALARLVDAGLPVLNQAVLLAGVNDDVTILQELCELLVQNRVFPYYLHHPDAAAGNASFRLSPARGLALWRELRQRVSGLALPAYVVDAPDGSGKLPVSEAFSVAPSS
jgi:lysine 2,3-aminomutase